MFDNRYDPWASKREPSYVCYICGGEGRAKNMTTVKSDNPILYGLHVTVHRGQCADKYRRRHG